LTTDEEFFNHHFGLDAKEDEEPEIKELSRAEIVLQKLQESGDKAIHSGFYNKLSSLNEKILLYKQVFYNRSPKFNRLTHS